MAKIAVAQFGQAKPCDPAIFGEQLSPGAEALGIFDGSDDCLHLHLIHLPKDAIARWTDSATGHLIYVWEGAMAVDGLALAAGSAMIVEHQGSAEAKAEGDGCLLLVFNRPVDAQPPNRLGGRIHRLPQERVPHRTPLAVGTEVGGSLFADAACPTCELWLHGNTFPPSYRVENHLHSEDEIIVVTDGVIALGRRNYSRGTALSIPRNTVYGFCAGKDGLRFVNFRPASPTYITSDGRISLDESKMYRELLGTIPYC
jgi:hypothetical protein